MPGTGLGPFPVRRPVRFSVRKVRSLGARDGTALAAFVPGRRWPAGGESVIDGDPGAPGQELVGEPVNVAFGLAGAGLSEQAGEFPEWDAAGIEQRREGVSEIMETAAGPERRLQRELPASRPGCGSSRG